MIILNEKEYAENCLRNGLVDGKPLLDISILAKYYYHCCDYKKKKITELLFEFLMKYYPRYELNEFFWKSSIEKIVANVNKFPIRIVDGIKVTRSEIDTITNIDNKVLSRLMFTMLCLAKLGNIKSPNNNGWVNIDTKKIFSYARISCNAEEREIKIGKLWSMGLLEFSKRNENPNCRVTFINDDDDEAMFVSDFRELGYEYLLYCGGNYVRCNECGLLIRNNKNGTKKYCNDCGTYSKQDTKNMICVDCGESFSVNSMNNTSCRCKSCQSERDIILNRISSAERMRRYRDKNSNVTAGN